MVLSTHSMNSQALQLCFHLDLPSTLRLPRPGTGTCMHHDRRPDLERRRQHCSHDLVYLSVVKDTFRLFTPPAPS